MSATSLILSVLVAAITATGWSALLPSLFGRAKPGVAALVTTAVASAIFAFFALFTLAFFLVSSEIAIWACAVLFGLILGSIVFMSALTSKRPH